MRIERVDLIHIRLPLVHPFETSNARLTELERLILKIYTPDGTVYSECVAGKKPLYTYESINTAKHILKDFIIPSVLGFRINGYEEYAAKTSHLKGHPMAKAAMENAVWILKARLEDKPLALLMGGQRNKVVSGVSVGIQRSVDELMERIDSLLAKGYPRVKIKIKPGNDVVAIKRVRSEYPDLSLMVDANSAYDQKDVELFRALDEYRLMMIEQALAYDDFLGHAKLQSILTTPICLDESIRSPSALRTALALKACGIVNIKQGRVGGLARAIEIHNIANENHVGVWCGGMLETGIGRAVNLALASLPNFIYPNDISESKRYWETDIIHQEFVLNPDGTIDVPSEPGLGVTINEEALKRFTLGKETIRI